MEQTRGISVHQFDFRRGRSSIDAINSVMEVVNKVGSGPLRKRELCALVSLDMANAFNSASWARIEESLVANEVPPYLIRILKSYLSNRYLLYGKAERRTITCGVSQGLALGPTLWNIMYDDLLR